MRVNEKLHVRRDRFDTERIYSELFLENLKGNPDR